MKIQLSTSELCLTENHPLRVEDARGLDIECLSGILWITHCGRLEDIFLAAGEHYRVHDQRELLLEAIGNTRIRLHPPRQAAAGWADRAKALISASPFFWQKRLTAALGYG